MSSFRLDALTLEVFEPDENRIRVMWTGRSDHREPQKALRQWFDQLIRTALASKSAIEMHFEQLAYFNSSTIAALLQFITTAHQSGVELDMVYEPKLEWQQRSFDGLQHVVRRLPQRQSKVRVVSSGNGNGPQGTE